MPRRKPAESSPEMSTLAAEVMAMKDWIGDPPVEIFNELLAKAKRLAGSVLSQDETKGQK
jgi:hypothetical protein